MVRQMDTEDRVSVKIGRLIKEKRLELNINQGQLARKLGYRHANFIGMLENGNAGFPLSRYRDYADALLVPRHEFAYLVAKELHPELLDDLFEAFKVRQSSDFKEKEERRRD